jgi:hypothetical protein
MKTFFLVLLLAFTATRALCQGDVLVSLTVVTNQNAPATNLLVVAVETTTLKRVTASTTSAGKATLKLAGGKEWTISVGEIKKCMQIIGVPGRTMTTNRFFVYDVKDYKRKQRQDYARSNATFKAIPQNASENSHYKEGECFLAVILRQPDGKPVQGIKVEAVNVKDSLVYVSKTDDKGNAFFILPNKSNYDIDVNDTRNLHYADFGNEVVASNLRLVYAPTVVKEKTVNDTTYQELDESAKPSSDRTLMRIFVSGGKKNGLRERVYLRQLPSGKVFSTITNDMGFAYFLVPFKYVYMVDFNYQKDVDAVNLLYTNEITTGQMQVRYVPDPRLEYPESFIPTPDRLILRSFNEFLEKQFSRPKDRPFALHIKSVFRLNKQSREALFMLTLAGSDTYGNVRLPLNAAFVLDKSGSMFSNGRAEALKRSLLDLGNTMSGKDIVSVVLFDDSAVEVQHTTSGHFEGFQQIAENYNPSGGTNILQGIQRGVESLRKSFDINKSNKIILLTDGYGDNPPGEVIGFVENQFRQGVEFSAIGLGNDYNQSLLELVAMKGHGTFSFVDESVMLSDAFLKEVKGSFAYAAKDLTIEVYHNRKMIFSNLFGYPVKDKTDQAITFEIGKVSHGANRIAFLKFKLNNPSQELEASPLTVKVSYFDLVKNQKVSYQEQVKLSWTNETETESLFDEQEKTLYAIAVLNQSMKLMSEAYERNEPKVAKEALVQGREQVETIFPGAKPKHVKEVFEEVDKYLKLFIQMEKNGG